MQEGTAKQEDIEGVQCTECGLMSTTYSVVCRRCLSGKLVKRKLVGRGRVRTFTILNVPSESFAADAPYAYVIVDLHEGCGTSGWMPSIKSAVDLAIGDEVVYKGRRGDAAIYVKTCG